MPSIEQAIRMAMRHPRLFPVAPGSSSGQATQSPLPQGSTLLPGQVPPRQGTPLGKFVPPQTFGPPNAEDAYANAREFFFSPETAGTGQQEHSHKKIEMGKDLVRLCHPASAGYSLGLVLVFMGKVNIPCGYVAVFEAVNHHRAPSLLASIHPADIRAFQEIETRCHTERPDYPSWTGHALQRWVPTWVQKEAQVGASRVLLYLPETWTKPGGSEEPTN